MKECRRNKKRLFQFLKSKTLTIDKPCAKPRTEQIKLACDLRSFCGSLMLYSSDLETHLNLVDMMNQRDHQIWKICMASGALKLEWKID